jgi:cytochrome c-type biogenesis protein CcmH/NrfF
MDWTPFYVTFAVLVLALWVVPAGIELALFQIRCWRVRRKIAREDHALSAHRVHQRDQRRTTAAHLHGLSARVRRMGSYDDAA